MSDPIPDRRNVNATWVAFVSAEPATAATEHGPARFVLVSLEKYDGTILDLGVSLAHAHDLAANVILCLAQHGDTEAQEIADKYFRERT